MTDAFPTKPGEGRGGQTLLHVALLAALSAVVFLPGIRWLPLMDPEEPRCALIVREMLEKGDWVVMHLHGDPYYDKPAPYFWVAGAATWLTGSAEVGGRGLSAISGIVAVAVTYFLGRRMFGARAGFVGGAMLATCGEFAFIARWYRMEMPFAAAMWGALLCFWAMEAPVGRTEVRRTRGWVGFYALCAVATLFKGPVGLALPAMIVAVYLLLSGRPRRLFELLHVPGMLVYIAIAAPWYVAVSLRDPAYPYQFFIVQNLERYGRSAKDEIFYATYVPVIVFGVAPWTVWLLETLPRMWPRPWTRRRERPDVFFLFIALVVPFVFFSLSGTKMVHYVLPVFAPAALLMGALAERFLAAEKFPGWGLVGLLGVAFAVAVCPVVLGCFTDDLDAWLAVPLATSVASGVVICVACRKDLRATALICAGAAVLVMYVFFIFDDSLSVYGNRSTRDLAMLVPPEGRDARFLSFGRKSLSFEYYARVKLEHVQSEDLSRLRAVFANTGKLYGLVEGDVRLETLRVAAGDNVVVVGRDGRFWLVSNRARARAGDE